MSGHVLAVLLSYAVVSDANASGSEIKPEERDYQNQVFNTWWGGDLVRKLADLPTEAKVPDYRIPYSGYIYPDSGGGTDVRHGGGLSALGKYDVAFHEGRGLAVAHERMDVGAHRNTLFSDQGLFGSRRVRLEQLSRPPGLFERLRARRTVGWYGHCNGWTAASIRHAEPQKSVTRNGVRFKPAHIKALLAEIYMYTETEFLGGIDPVINPGTLHITLANWIGRGDHPVGMDDTVGKVVWNYPIHAYKATVTKRSEREADVKLEVTYAGNSNYEMDKSPRIKKTMNFHYLLNLDENGEILGGRYYGDSRRIDMLWTPLKPVQGGEEGNENGNPHLDVKQILAIWRESVPEDLCKKWQNIDPIHEEEQENVPPASELRQDLQLEQGIEDLTGH